MYDGLISQLPALLVVFPLLSSAILVILKERKKVYFFTCLVIFINFILVLLLTKEVQSNGIVSYHFGNWAPPIGIEFRIDHLSLIVMIFISMSAAILMPWMGKNVSHYVSEKREYLFYTMFLLCYAGLMGIASTNDAFNLFVFLEVSSLSTYVMIAMGQDRRGITAAFNYLIMGTIGATFYIIAVSMLYQMTGTLNITDMAARLTELPETRTYLVALAFIFTGFALKAAIFPLHSWLPRAYTYGLFPAITFLSATATKVSLYALIRLSDNFFVLESKEFALLYEEIFIALGILAMVIGASAATRQYNMRQILAFSSISQMGYMVMALGFVFSSHQKVADAAIVALTFHMFSHALVKGSLFMSLGSLSYRGLGPWLVQFKGRARSMPLTMGAFIIGGMGLIGIPGTTGFVSKLYLIRMAALNESWFVVAAILITSGLAVIYFWRLIEVGYLMRAHPRAEKVKEAPKSMLISMLVASLMVIFFGLNSQPLMKIIKEIPEDLRLQPHKIDVPLEPLSKKYLSKGDH